MRLANGYRVGLLAATILAAPAAARAAPPSTQPAEIVASLLPTVVNIAITSYVTSAGGTGNMAAHPTTSERRTNGSGFIVDASGIIATNRHVVAKAQDIVVILDDGTHLKATLLAAAAQTDLALLQVRPDHKLPVVTFGDSDITRPGDPVIVIGNPLGLGGTVTAGIVSALDRNTDESEAGSFIQIDAALNTGNSGGPVFNTSGELIGVSTALFSPSGDSGSVGLGFAIPGNDAKYVLRGLREDGGLRLGWIGAHIQKLTPDLAQALGLAGPDGSMITGIEDGSPAAQAGLQEGDVVLDIGGEVTAAPRLFNRIVASSAIGDTVRLAVWRGGTRQQVAVKIGERASDAEVAKKMAAVEAPPPRSDRADLGLSVGPLDAGARTRLGLAASQTGVLVTGIAANSPAGDHDISPGAAILNLQHQPVGTPDDVARRIAAARAEKRGAVLLLVADRQGRRWVSIPLQ